MRVSSFFHFCRLLTCCPLLISPIIRAIGRSSFFSRMIESNLSARPHYFNFILRGITLSFSPHILVSRDLTRPAGKETLHDRTLAYSNLASQAYFRFATGQVLPVLKLSWPAFKAPNNYFYGPAQLVLAHVVTLSEVFITICFRCNCEKTFPQRVASAVFLVFQFRAIGLYDTLSLIFCFMSSTDL